LAGSLLIDADNRGVQVGKGIPASHSLIEAAVFRIAELWSTMTRRTGDGRSLPVSCRTRGNEAAPFFRHYRWSKQADDDHDEEDWGRGALDVLFSSTFT
jgi:hypothetical protein